MNPRERILAMVVVGVVLLCGGFFLFNQMFLGPLKARDKNISTLQEEIDKKRTQVAKAVAEQAKLTRWRQLSLPPDVYLAQRKYEEYLSELLFKSGFARDKTKVITQNADSRTSPQLTGKKPVYTVLPFLVEATGTEENLVKMLEGFYRTGLFHKIKQVGVDQPQVLTPQQRTGELQVKLAIEALIVNGAENRSYLLPNIDRRLLLLEVSAALRGAPTGLPVALWAAGPTGPQGPGNLATMPRNYAAIPKKNIFLGPPPEEPKREVVDVRGFVYLIHIARGDQYSEAFLYDRTNDTTQRLRNSASFSKFRVRDDAGETVLEGKVVHIDQSDVIFSVENEKDGLKYFSIHIGQTIEDALQKSLAREQVEALIKERTQASLEKK